MGGRRCGRVERKKREEKQRRGKRKTEKKQRENDRDGLALEMRGLPEQRRGADRGGPRVSVAVDVTGEKSRDFDRQHKITTFTAVEYTRNLCFRSIFLIFDRTSPSISFFFSELSLRIEFNGIDSFRFSSSSTESSGLGGAGMDRLARRFRSPGIVFRSAERDLQQIRKTKKLSGVVCSLSRANRERERTIFFLS